jgi:hypothetical protein
MFVIPASARADSWDLEQLNKADRFVQDICSRRAFDCERDRDLLRLARKTSSDFACGDRCPPETAAENKLRVNALYKSVQDPIYHDIGIRGVVSSWFVEADLRTNQDAVNRFLDRLDRESSSLNSEMAALESAPGGLGDCPDAFRERLTRLNWAAGGEAADVDGVQHLINSLQDERRVASQDRVNVLSQYSRSLQDNLLHVAYLRCPGLQVAWRSETVGAALAPQSKPKNMRLQAPNFEGNSGTGPVWAGIAEKPRPQSGSTPEWSPVKPTPIFAVKPLAPPPPASSILPAGLSSKLSQFKRWWAGEKKVESETSFTGLIQQELDNPFGPLLTRTVGGPKDRAAYVFQQREGDCEIASEQEILTAAGILDRNKPYENERRMIAEASALGIYHGRGVKMGDSGTLLAHHGLSVVRNDQASVDDLNAAVKQGKWILTGVDASVLWNDERYKGGHAITITGGEVMMGLGRVPGYYIDDTGAGIGGRYVTAGQFLAAWEHWMVVVQ